MNDDRQDDYSGMDDEDYFWIGYQAAMSPEKVRSYASRAPDWEPPRIPEPEGHRMVPVGYYNRVDPRQSTLRHILGLIAGFFTIHLGAIAIVVVLGLAANWFGWLGFVGVIAIGTIIRMLLRNEH